MEHNFENKSPIKLYTEFTKDTKKRIAEVIEEKHKELWLSPIASGYIVGTTRALDYGDYWGTLGKTFKNGKSDWEKKVNKNSDLFNYNELIELDEEGIPRYLSYRKANFYINHKSHDISLSCGIIFDSVMVHTSYEDPHIVILFGIDRMKAANIVRTLETYPTRVYTSMGCSIKSSMCTACGKIIKKDTDLCNCLKFNRGGRAKGKKVAELLQQMSFYEQSFVSQPACASAAVIEAVSEILPGRILKVASEVGNAETDTVMQIISNINYSIRNASQSQEKKRLSNQLDALIYKLEGMLVG